MYFGRNSYDPDAVREAQSRLQSFQGATAISSNQYFGREEEDDVMRMGGGGGSNDGSLLGDGSSLAGLENAARDAVTRVLSNPDVQNVGETIRTGALRVCQFFFSFFFGLFDLTNFFYVNSFLITWLQCLNVHNDNFYFSGRAGSRSLDYICHFFLSFILIFLSVDIFDCRGKYLSNK